MAISLEFRRFAAYITQTSDSPARRTQAVNSRWGAGTRYSQYSHWANQFGYDCRKMEARRQTERRVPNADEEDRP